MVDHITNRTPTTDIEADCELKKIEGSVQDLSVYRNKDGNDIILKNKRS